MQTRTCFIGIVVLVAVCATASADDRLTGTWRPIAGQADGVTTIVGNNGNVRLRFAEGRVTWLYDNLADSGLPKHGATFDCAFDLKRSPNRVSFREPRTEAWAYCIYDVKDDTLMIRMLLPMALGQTQVSEDKRQAFYRDRFPSGFTTTKDDATSLMILRRVAND